MWRGGKVFDKFFHGDIDAGEPAGLEEGVRNDFGEAFDEVETLGGDDGLDGLDDGFVIERVAEGVGVDAGEFGFEVEDHGYSEARSGCFFLGVDAMISKEFEILDNDLCLNHDEVRYGLSMLDGMNLEKKRVGSI